MQTVWCDRVDSTQHLHRSAPPGGALIAVGIFASAPHPDLFWSAFGRAADVLTVIAAVVALAGLLWTWMVRPRLDVSVSYSDDYHVLISIRHAKGAAPARYLSLGRVWLDASGRSKAGDASPLWLPELLPGAWQSITMFDPGRYFQTPPPPPESSVELGADDGAVCYVSWQRPLVPWLRTGVAVSWLPSDRAAMRPPTVTKGRTGLKQFRAAFHQGSSAPKRWP